MIEDIPPPNMLLYGPNGAGKTYFAGTANALIVDVEQGSTTLAAAGIKVPVWKLTKFEEINEVYEYLRKDAGKTHSAVAIDSYTDLTAKGLETVVDEAEERDPDRLTDAAELRDHGRVTLKLGRVLRRFRDLPIPVILICAVREPDEQDVRYRPHLPRGVRIQAQDYTDMIGYLSVVETKDDEGKVVSIDRKLLFYSPSGAIICRDRYGVFTAETGRRGLTNPAWSDIMHEVMTNAPVHKKQEGKAKKTSKRR
jgi:hypothetical protein